MTRVFGQLFEDKRDGYLFIKPSKPFFGCDRHGKLYPVTGGFIDIQLQPTPPDAEYLIAFKEPGDMHRPDFTLRWRVRNTSEIDVTPAQSSTEKEVSQAPTARAESVQVKRLATELAASMQSVADLEQQLFLAQQQLREIESKFSAHRDAAAQALTDRDRLIEEIQAEKDIEVRTVVKEVPVSPKRLEDRIKYLESELLRTKELNSEYYLSVLELHQLKLERAQSLPSIPQFSGLDDNPRSRLINKLLNK